MAHACVSCSKQWGQPLVGCVSGQAVGASGGRVGGSQHLAIIWLHKLERALLGTRQTTTVFTADPLGPQEVGFPRTAFH